MTAASDWPERLGEDSSRWDRPRIFGIGLNKTGTSSFDAAMRILGFESLHWGGPPVRHRIEAALEAGAPLLSNLDQRFDAFSDIVVLSKNFALLDEQYPGSRFVLTVRPIDAWIDSRRRHVEQNRRRLAAGTYDGTFLVVDEEAWRQEWFEHVTQVRDYFEGRDDLLEVDLTSTPGWSPLCRFLQVPEPDAAFPWANRDGTTRVAGAS
jgi:hypothetical protein